MSRKASYAAMATIVAAIAMSCLAYGSELPDVVGVFGLTRADSSAAIGVWGPLAAGQAVSGFYWFNNDSETVIPEVLVQAVDCGRPDEIEYATPVVRDLRGGSMTWSYCEFETPIASEASGLYILFRLGDDGVRMHDGGGGGIGLGIIEGGGARTCWMTSGGADWEAMFEDYTGAVVFDISAEKSDECVLIYRSTRGQKSGVGRIAEYGDLATPSPQVRIGAYPNPFNPSTNISFVVPSSGTVGLDVYDVGGRHVIQLYGGYLEAGEKSISWNGRDDNGRSVASGVYFVRLSAGDVAASSSVTLLE